MLDTLDTSAHTLDMLDMFNMFNMRNRATKKLNNAKKGPRPIQGVSWPVTNDKGDRSTTVTNRAM